MLEIVKKNLAALVFIPLTLIVNVAYSESNDLELVVKTAPIVPHGLLVGKPFDITISFVDLDPAVPGIAMKKGGWAKIALPNEIINTGFPVSQPGKAKGCEPPVLARCSSGGFLHGWPQGPILPLNTIDYDEDSHSLLLTATADTPSYSIDTPGTKLIHLFTFGFMNPNEPGEYPLTVEIKPDPTSDDVLVGSTMLNITDKMQANTAIDTTQSIHVKGPHYRNTMFQTIAPGTTSRNMSSNIWNALHEPIVGASISMTDHSSGNLIAEDGTVIGALSIQAPPEAKGHYLLTRPSFVAKTGLAGFPTGRLVTALKTAPKIAGTYIITLSLADGNKTIHTVNTQ